MVTFSDIIKDEAILAAFNDLGFTEPTPIQAETIPLGTEGVDIIGQAKTGSGKTFAFGVPILANLKQDKYLQALIITPTRELTQQVAREMRKIGKRKQARIVEVYGGVSINPQIDELAAGGQVVVGTPGRILDHMERGTIKTEGIMTLVLDEADRMLDMGFIDDIENIINSCPSDRQMLLFSATMPEEIKRLAQRHLHQPHHIKTVAHVEEEYLPQHYYVVPHNRKFSLLMHLLEKEKAAKTIIFCGTRRTAEVVARNLKRHNQQAGELHGGLTQAKRNYVMDGFRKGKIMLLVATDVAARGLDIQDVSHVINYDVPRNPEDYIHRIGRTARAGKKGTAITLLEDRDFDFFQAILNIVPQEPEKIELDDFKTFGFSIGGRDDRHGGPRRGGFGESRGPRRDGPRRSESHQRHGGRSSGKKSSDSHDWKQSMRRR